jgi:hypothetical protein
MTQRLFAVSERLLVGDAGVGGIVANVVLFVCVGLFWFCWFVRCTTSGKFVACTIIRTFAKRVIVVVSDNDVVVVVVVVVD